SGGGVAAAPGFDSRDAPATFCHCLHNAFFSCILYVRDVHFPVASLIEGSLPEAILGGAGQVASPARLMDRPHRVEAQETRSSGQCDPCGEQGCRTTPEGIPDNGKHGHEPQNRHGGASRGERSLFTGNAGVSNKTPRAGHGAQIRVPRRHSCARRRSPPPRGVEKEVMVGDVPEEKGEEEDEDEVGDRETDRTKIAGWVERRGPARARAKPENNNHRAAGPGVSPRSTQPTALRYGGALFAGLFDIVNMKSAARSRDCRVGRRSRRRRLYPLVAPAVRPAM